MASPSSLRPSRLKTFPLWSYSISISGLTLKRIVPAASGSAETALTSDAEAVWETGAGWEGCAAGAPQEARVVEKAAARARAISFLLMFFFIRVISLKFLGRWPCFFGLHR